MSQLPCSTGIELRAVRGPLLSTHIDFDCLSRFLLTVLTVVAAAAAPAAATFSVRWFGRLQVPLLLIPQLQPQPLELCQLQVSVENCACATPTQSHQQGIVCCSLSKGLVGG